MSNHKVAVVGATAAVLLGLGTVAIKWMNSADRATDREAAKLLSELEATVDTPPRTRGASIESVVRYQLEVDGQAHDVIDGKASIAGPDQDIFLSPAPTRTFNGQDFAFEYPGTLVVGATEGSVSVTSGDTDLRFLVVDTANPSQLLEQAVVELETMSGQKAHDSKQRIGGEDVVGKTLRMDAIGRAKELYVVALDETTGLNIEIVRALNAKSPEIAALLASISTKPLEARDDFIARATSKELGGLRVGVTKEFELDGKARAFRLSPRESVRHRLGRVVVEYPQSAVSGKVETALGGGLQIGLHATAISVLIVPLTPTEVASAFLAGQRDPMPVSREIAGGTRSGSRLMMTGMTLELFTIPQGTETLVVMTQYADTAELDAAAPAVLASIRVE